MTIVIILGMIACNLSNSHLANDDLIKSIMSSDYDTVNAARDSLIVRGQEVVPLLVKRLDDPIVNDTLRGRIAYIIGEIGPVASVASDVLLQIAQNEKAEYQLRMNCMTALGKLGPDSYKALPYLRKVFVNSDSEYQKRIAVEAICGLQYEATPALPDIFKVYKSFYSESVRFSIEEGLVLLGQYAIDTLIVLAKDSTEEEYFRKRAVNIIGRISPKIGLVSEELAHMIIDTTLSAEFRIEVVNALKEIGISAYAATPELIEVMDQERTWLAQKASEAIIEIGKPAIIHLKQVIENTEEDKYRRAMCVEVIGEMGPKAKDVVSYLVELLRDTTKIQGENWLINRYDVEIRSNAITALGKIGSASVPAIPHLVPMTGASYFNDRSAACVALMRIAESCVDNEDYQALPELESAYDSVLVRERVSFNMADWNDESIQRFRRSINTLKQIRNSSKWFHFNQFIQENPWVYKALLLLALYAFITVVCFLLYFLSPILLLSINRFLEDSTHDKKWQWKLLTFIIGYIAVVKLFHYRKRVLDAWVRKVLPKVMNEFEELKSVKSRNCYVDVPFEINKSICDGVKSIEIKKIIKKNRVRILVWGVGGGGKSSLAFQLAREVASNEKNDRICNNYAMLPIILENDFHEESDNRNNAFLTAVQGVLSSLTGSELPINVKFVEHLLRTKCMSSDNSDKLILKVKT